MANAYEYQPLPEGDYIRVLILNPGTDDEPLSGDLRVIQLIKPDQDPDSAQESNGPSGNEVIRWAAEIPYEAISYVWGSYERDHIIFLSGNTHRITANLSGALYQCRLSDQPRALWADSICIDQESLDEKNHQVYMMGRIYASAQYTLICLGTIPDYQDQAQDAVSLVSDVNKMIQGVFQNPDFSWAWDSFPRPLLDNPLINDSRWQSIHTLLGDPWFGRGWIVQEAAVARKTCILWAGCTIAPPDLFRAGTWYKQRARILADKNFHTTPRRGLLQRIFFHETSAEYKVFYRKHKTSQQLDILAALRYARRLGLSDPRDRVYAFMSLPFVRNPMSDIHPNYKQSHLELYQDFAVKYLEETSNLDILSYVTPTEVEGVSADSGVDSSWVPRWDHTSQKIYGRTSTKLDQESAHSDDMVVLYRENGAPALLQLRAVIFDSIKLISRLLYESMTIKELVTSWSEFTKRADYASEQAKCTSACNSLFFLQTLSAGYALVAGTAEDPDVTLKLYASFLQANDLETGSQENPQISSDIQFLHRGLMATANGSRVFTLERGYFGLGPWSIKQGDICAFVFGVSLPLVLRKVPDEGAGHYKVIGSAFVVSMKLDEEGLPNGLNELYEWRDWHKLCEREGWTDGGLKEERIILH